jgi:hypothetical protein
MASQHGSGVVDLTLDSDDESLPGTEVVLMSAGCLLSLANSKAAARLLASYPALMHSAHSVSIDGEHFVQTH